MSNYIDAAVQIDRNFKPFEKAVNDAKKTHDVKDTSVTLDDMARGRDQINRFAVFSTDKIIMVIKQYELEIESIEKSNPRFEIIENTIKQLRNELNCR